MSDDEPEIEIYLHDPDAQPRWEGEARDEWCDCDDANPRDVIYRDDGECDCGIEKHHYHCPHCGGVTQIG